MTTETNMAAKQSLSPNLKLVLHVFIMLAIVFGFRLLPAPNGVTPFGMAVAGVFLGLVYGWTFLDIFWTSLLGVFLLAITGYGSCEKIMVEMFSNSTVLMMMMGVLAFGAVLQSGAGDWVMGKLFSSKIAQKSPTNIVIFILLAGVIGNTIGLGWFLYFGMFPLISKTLKKCGYEKGDKFCYFVLAGFLMGVQLGMSVRPFVGWPLMTCGSIASMTKVPINYGTYMLLMVIICALFVLTYPLLMRLCGCDFSKIANLDVADAFGIKEGGINKRQKLSLISLLVFVVTVIAMSLLNTYVPALKWLNTQVTVLGLMVLLFVFVLVVKVDDKPLLDIREASKGFTWDMLFLIAIALLLSNVLTSQETGISAWLSGLLRPVFPNGGFIFLIALAVVTTILTNFCNNIAVCFIMINLVSSMYLNGFDVNLLAASMVIALTTTICAFLTPASSMPGAMLHADSNMTASVVYKGTLLLMVYSVLLLLVVLIPYTLLT